jgi:hypothetical protein
MTIARTIRTTAIALTIALGSAVLSSCAVDGGGYGYGPDVDVGVGFGYYDTGGYYGGWGRGYRVGPGRGNYHHDDHGHGSTHSYRAAPAGRSAPSIPSRGHSGGGHSSDRHH